MALKYMYYPSINVLFSKSDKEDIFIAIDYYRPDRSLLEMARTKGSDTYFSQKEKFC